MLPIHYLIAGAQTDVVECVGLKLDEERHQGIFVIAPPYRVISYQGLLTKAPHTCSAVYCCYPILTSTRRRIIAIRRKLFGFYSLCGDLGPDILVYVFFPLCSNSINHIIWSMSFCVSTDWLLRIVPR